MFQTLPRFQPLIAVVLAMGMLLGACAQAPSPDAPGADAESTAGAPLASAERSGADSSSGAGTLSCEVYCSETKLRTANARISWDGTGALAGRASASAASAAPVAQELQTTVFKGGYDKDLYASFSTLDSGQRAAARTASALPEPSMRAYDLSIVPAAQPDARVAASAAVPASRTSVDVEGLEPGMRYTWRVVFATADGEEISETVTCEAPVCPADLQEVAP